MRLTPLALTALLLLAACGSDTGGAVQSEAPPSTPTSTSQPEQCSTAGVRIVLEDQDLPEAVAEKRTALFDAAVACDFDALADEAGDQFNYTFGDPGDGPASYWRQEEAAGHPVLRQLAQVLNLPSAERDELEGKPYRSWPSADQEHRTQADWDALKGLYTDEQVEQFQAADSYTGWRTAITDAGDWMYFVAGD